ncbi:MAG: LytR C-terminal domain-containing protein [Actinomycetota bacterium]
MNEAVRRLLVVAAAVLVGVLVLAKGFQGSSAAVSPTQPPHSSSPSSPTPSTSASSTRPAGNGGGGVQPKQQGVVVAIYNATSTNGLAGAAATALTKKGYAVKPPGNFPPAPTTTIYYKDEQGKADAGLLKQDLIPGAVLKKLQALPPGNQIPHDAVLIVVLGADYAATHPVPNG